MKKYNTHPFLLKYPVKTDIRGLIIGTHPPMPYEGELLFYYGNMNEFWRLLNKIYPKDSFFNSNDRPDLKLIFNWLNKYQLGITDMLQYTLIGNQFSIDSKIQIDDLNYQLNQNLDKWIENSKIEKIYFTSFSSNKSAYALFKKWCRINYKLKLPSGIEIISSGNAHEIIIFNRKIILVMLYSPSPSARRGIPRSNPYLEWKNKPLNKNKTIDDFRVWWYSIHMPNPKK
jgi:G:T/U-mismatch repair DNA glycosylase